MNDNCEIFRIRIFQGKFINDVMLPICAAKCNGVIPPLFDTPLGSAPFSSKHFTLSREMGRSTASVGSHYYIERIIRRRNNLAHQCSINTGPIPQSLKGYSLLILIRFCHTIIQSTIC